MTKIETPAETPRPTVANGKAEHWTERVRRDLALALQDRDALRVERARLVDEMDEMRDTIASLNRQMTETAPPRLAGLDAALVAMRDAAEHDAEHLRCELDAANGAIAALREQLASRPAEPLSHPVVFAAVSWFAARCAVSLVSEIVRDEHDEMLATLTRAAGDAEDRLMEAVSAFVAKRKED